MKKDDFYIEPASLESPAERAARHSRRRKIKTVVVIITIIVVILAIWIVLGSQGPFDPRGLIKSRYPWLG